jgi:hypothetical protein
MPSLARVWRFFTITDGGGGGGGGGGGAIPAQAQLQRTTLRR